jgi:hydrogenase-4 component B
MLRFLILCFLIKRLALVAYCFVKLFGISFLGKPRSTDSEKAKEPGKPMLAALAISAGLCTILGIVPKYSIKLIDCVSSQLINIKLLSTNWSLSTIQHYPVENGGLNISVGWLTVLVLVFGGVLAILIFALRKKTSVEYYNTWDCGFTKLNSKMQYSATGFSKSLRIIFRGLFKPARELVVTEGIEPYYIKKGKYTTSTVKVFEKYLYEPFVSFLINFSRKIRFTIQTGSIHTYLMYFFGIMILMLLYYSIAAA